MFGQNSVTAVLLAAGGSARFGREDKLTAPLGGRTVLEWAADALFSSPLVDQRVLVAAPERLEELRVLLSPWPGLVAVPGGATRNESALRGISAASGDIVLTHDGARPFLTPEIVERCVRGAAEHGACAAAIPASDTIKLAAPDGMVRETTRRRDTWRVQTPQAFWRRDLLAAYGLTDPADPALTDDCMVMERAGRPVKLVAGAEENMKITTPRDYALARAMGPLLGLWEEARPLSIRTSIGQDSHRAGPPDAPGTMVLGGVPFPGHPPLLANSDGDVVIHALVNAISGVSCENILGERADRICQSGVTDSAVYVGEALRFLTGRVVHASFTIECKTPKISPRIPEMRRRIGELLGLPPNRVGITATSGEGLTGFGRGEGISVFCIITVEE